MPVYPGLGVVRDESGQRVWNQRSPAGRITQATREAQYASQSNKNGAQWRVTLRKVPDILNRLQKIGRQGLHDFQLMEAIADAFELSAYDRAGVYSTYWLIGGSEAIRAETSNGGGIHLVHGTHVCFRSATCPAQYSMISPAPLFLLRCADLIGCGTSAS